jgi:hypothetical protein
MVLPTVRSIVWPELVHAGFERMDRQLADAGPVAGHLVPAGSMFAFLAQHQADVFPDEDYADLFAPVGRVGRHSGHADGGGADAAGTARLFRPGDGQAARFDVRWKAAVGTALDDPEFHPSTLVYWRRKLAASERPHQVSDPVRK